MLDRRDMSSQTPATYRFATTAADLDDFRKTATRVLGWEPVDIEQVSLDQLSAGIG